jgi:hypothetical protein
MEKCGKSESDCESEPKSGCEMTDQMMVLANEAWAELVKEKMKKRFEEVSGEKMNKIALASVEASMAYWQHKMKGKQGCMEHTQKMQQAFLG